MARDSALAAAKFGRNAARWLGMEAGFVVQNVYLTCTSLGLGTVMIGGYGEPKTNEAFRLDPNWKALGLRSIGRKKQPAIERPGPRPAGPATLSLPDPDYLVNTSFRVSVLPIASSRQT